MIKMIKSDSELDSNLLLKTLSGRKMLAYMKAYGAGYDFCRFYKITGEYGNIGEGYMFIINSTLIICGDGQLEADDELQIFINMNMPFRIEGDQKILSGISREDKYQVLNRTIFELVPEKYKLKLIIYNNQLKDKLEINLQIYKEKSCRCRIIDKNGQGQETSLKTKKIIFKGHYLNGSKNGLGAEYNSRTGKLIFQGNYLNGKRNGKGKEYDKNIKCIFEGEYLNNDKKNGKFKGYYKEGSLFFEGEYKNGEKIGMSKEFSNGQIIF